MSKFKNSEELQDGKYYVYRHIRNDINMPFYIGVGTKTTNKSFEKIYKRAFSKKNRTDYWNRIAAKSDFEVDIIYHTDNRDELQAKEVEFINLYKRSLDGGTLCNLTTGGDYNFSHPKSTWEKRKATYVKNGTYQEMINRMVKYCNKGDGIGISKVDIYVYDLSGSFLYNFKSLKECREKLKIVNSTINVFLDTNKSIKKYILKSKYVGEKIDVSNYEIPKSVLNGGRDRKSIPCLVVDEFSKEIVFDTIKEAANYVNHPNVRSLSNLISETKFYKYKNYKIKRNVK